MTEGDKLKFEQECDEVKLQCPKDGWKTLVHPSGVTVETRMSAADLDKCQLTIFPEAGTAEAGFELENEQVTIEEPEPELEDPDENWLRNNSQTTTDTSSSNTRMVASEEIF
jgi:hypothetical protein